MKKGLFTLLGAIGLCLGICIGVPDTIDAAPVTTVQRNVSATYTGWVTNDDGSYSYYEDGVIVQSKVIKIGTSYYGFDYEGIMYSNVEFSMWSDESGSSEVYRASASGVLYQNTWFQDGDNWYYFSNDCSALEGINTIAGANYYFYYDGRLAVNEAIETDQGNYAADGQGVLKKLTNNTWTKVGANWYYVKNNEIPRHEILLISGQYYVFDSWGRMHTNNEYLFNIYEDDEAFYRAKADGTLCRNEWYHYTGDGDTWYYYDDDTWFYYGNDCKAVKGFNTIGGKKYYFDSTAAMVTDEAFTVDNVCYVALSDGTVAKLNNGWNYVGKYWYYVNNNNIAKEEKKLISGQYYFFDWQGHMLSDSSYGIYDNNADKYVYYHAKEDGTLYRNEWYIDDWNDKYYFNNNCEMVLGLQTINGKLYYITEWSGVTTDSVFMVDDTYYAANEEGVLVKLAKTGWSYAHGEWYYVSNGNILRDGMFQISGKYYMFDYYGRMYSDTHVYLYSEYTYGYYRAKADGSLCRNEWYLNKDGKWEYFGNDCAGINGIHTISGVKYYFYDGILSESGYASDGSGKAYLIGKGGVLITNQKGWYYYNNEWYYMNSDGSLYYGLLTLGGKSYYMGYNMRCNTNLINVDGVLYQAKDSTGVLTKITKEGFYTDSYSTYYVLNGKVATGWKYLNGGWRYFQTDGSMVLDTTYWIDDSKYAFDYNGVMYSNTWVSSYSYATASGALAVGKYIINGKTYYFNDSGYLITSGYNNGKYYIDGIEHTFSNGWNNVDGDWYYAIGGELVNGEQSIGGKYYYFYDYVMVSNEKMYNRFYGSDGAAVKGWIKKDGYWFYADESYYLQYGLTEIDGVEYYFNNGCMATSDILSGEYIYSIGTDGVIKNTSKVKEGWNYVGCRAYYIKDGNYYTGWLGESYISYGEKVFDEIIYSEEYDAYYYINKNGVCAYNVWYQPNSYYDTAYYYAGANGKLKCDEWVYINGSWYYFDEYRQMTTGILEESGTTYYLDRNGKLAKTFNTITNGWHYVAGDWLYVRNGKFVISESLYIDGSYYTFDTYGRMYKNCLTGSRTYGADGRMKFDAGWYYLDGYWYYLNMQGGLVWGEWININGNKYYLDAAMITGYRVVDNELYYFDSQGICKGKYGVTDGWYSAGGALYYFVDGKAITSEILVINGTRYAFDWEGKMITNGIAQDYSYDYSNDNIYYYFGSDGAVVTKAGIYTTADGGKVYVSANGEAHTGVVYVNGKIQYMDAK